MRVLHPEDLLQIAADRGHLRLSLFLPTDRREPGKSVNQARWGALVRSTRAAMRADGVPAALVRAVCDGPLDLLTEAWPWERPDNGLAMFAAPDSCRCYWLPRPVPALATFGDRFALCPLFPMLTRENEAQALAVYRTCSRADRTVTEPAELEVAAERGWIDTLFVSTTVIPRPAHADDHLIRRLADCPIATRRADTAAEAVLRHGGTVRSLPPERMPEPEPMAATLRRSAPSTQRKTRSEASLP